MTPGWRVEQAVHSSLPEHVWACCQGHGLDPQIKGGLHTHSPSDVPLQWREPGGVAQAIPRYFIGVDFECRSQRNLEGVSNLTENALGTPQWSWKGGSVEKEACFASRVAQINSRGWMNGWMEKCHSDTREGATLPELPDQVTVCCRKLISPTAKEAWGLACVGLWLPQDVRISLVKKKKFVLVSVNLSSHGKERKKR